MHRCRELSWVLYLWTELVFLTLLRKGTVEVDSPMDFMSARQAKRELAQVRPSAVGSF